jgi:hypothetical protein
LGQRRGWLVKQSNTVACLQHRSHPGLAEFVSYTWTAGSCYCLRQHACCTVAKRCLPMQQQLKALSFIIAAYGNYQPAAHR